MSPANLVSQSPSLQSLVSSLPILTPLSLSPSQAAAVLASTGDVAVTAGAGTGKTRTLVARFLAIATSQPLRHIVAVTFTRKAAQEMRNRIRRAIGDHLDQPDLDAAERDWWQTQYDSLDAARIGTIHTLCAEILRAHPAEAQLDPNFAVLDEAPTNLLRRDAVEAALGWAAGDPSAVALFRFFSERDLWSLTAALLQNRLTAEDILAKQPAEETAAAVLTRWQEKVEALQAQTLDRLTTDPLWQSHITTLRTNAARSPDDRLEIQRQFVVAALAAALPAEATAKAVTTNPETVADRRRKLAAIATVDLRGGSAKAWPGGKEQLEEVRAALRGLRDRWKAERILALDLNDADTSLAAATPALIRLFRFAATSYQTAKATRDVLDFDDLEHLAIQLLSNHPAVRQRWQSIVQALLVDEFQDTNGRQRQLFRLLCPAPGRLFIVGDAKQSIYRFRGAEVSVFREEQNSIAGKGGAIEQLATSYRAHAALINDLNHLLRPILGDPTPDLPGYIAPFEPLMAPPTNDRRPPPVYSRATADHLLPATSDVAEYSPTIAHLPPPFIELHLTIGAKSDGALEQAAQMLAARLVTLCQMGNLRLDQAAVLCRASTSFAAYENAFDEANIPYQTVAGRGFYERPEIRDLLNALHALTDPTDNLALIGLLRSPAFGLSDLALYQLHSAANGRSLWPVLQEAATGQHSLFWDAADHERVQRAAALIHHLHAQSGRREVADLLKAFLDTTGYRAMLRHAGQPRAARNVAKLLADAHASALVSSGAFIEWVTGLRDSGGREGEARATADGAVQIMSVHAAKGLEFPIVVIGDANSAPNRTTGLLFDSDLGFLPTLNDDAQNKAAVYTLAQLQETAQADAESRRLLYVAATRAEQKLLINGQVILKKDGQPGGLNGWLKEIAAATGLDSTDLSDYDETGDRLHSFELPIGDTAVSVHIYEPNYQPIESAVLLPTADDRPPTADPSLSTPLLVTLSPSDVPIAHPVTLSPSDVPIAHPVTLSPRIIGSLVHEALALWRFPDAAEFDQWTAARARDYGLSNEEMIDNAGRQARRHLNRFRSHPLYREIETAERRLHEVPFQRLETGRLETEREGVIDLLYWRDGRWTVVEFKTDHIPDEASIESFLVKEKIDYLAQMAGYGAAVEELVGERPRLLLCLLNVNGQIITREL